MHLLLLMPRLQQGTAVVVVQELEQTQTIVATNVVHVVEHVQNAPSQSLIKKSSVSAE
jgi:hypothetical protein